MTRVFPLPAPARMSTGPSVVSTASRCCGFSWERKDKEGTAPETLVEFYRIVNATFCEDCTGKRGFEQSLPVFGDHTNDVSASLQFGFRFQHNQKPLLRTGPNLFDNADYQPR